MTSPLFNERWDEVDRDCDGEIDAMVTRDAFTNYKSVSGIEGVGMSSAVIGDITGDGIAEVLMGAPYSFYDSTQDPDSGAITRENTMALLLSWIQHTVALQILFKLLIFRENIFVRSMGHGFHGGYGWQWFE